jgi:2-octaprenyl-6-methoxyphenol hydroxylase
LYRAAESLWLAAGAYYPCRKRTVYPLSLTTASQSISHRLALVGNAAQTLHPIAGQGFNLGLRDVMSLAETLAQAWGEQKDCGAYSVLSHYQKRRG